MATQPVTNAENSALIAFAKETLGVEVLHIEQDGLKVPVAVLPDGKKLMELKPIIDKFRPAPERRRGVAVMRDIESFIAFVNLYKDASSVLFVNPDPKQPVLIAVLDYNHSGTGQPRYGEHRARYAFPLSEEWEAWVGHNEEWLTQGEFATFIEDRLTDVASPGDAGDGLRDFAKLLNVEYASPSRLLELSRGLTLSVESRLKEQRNLSSGEAQLFFQEEHKDETGAPIRVPNAFIIKVPVFQFGAAHLMAVRLRYRVKSGQVTWQYAIHKIALNLDTAIREECGRAQGGTGLMLLYGVPEDVRSP